MKLLALKPRTRSMKIMHILQKLILSISKMGEGVKQDVHWCNNNALFYDYSFTRRELSPI